MKIAVSNMWYGTLLLIGGLGMFLYGIYLLSEGLQLAAGESLRRTLEGFTKSRIRGVLAGTAVTSLIQSSSATTVMLVGFVNAGLMTFTMSVPVIFGANIGTTITAQIVAFNVKVLAFPLIGVGILLFLVAERRKIKYSGQALLGFGVLFLGMELMKSAMSPLAEAGIFESWIKSFSSHWFLGLLIGIIITSLVQSSSATTGMVVAMAASGALSVKGVDPLRVAIPIILGCNIGTCITAFLASLGTSLPAQRVAVAHYLFNISGVLIFLPFFKWFPDVVRWVSEIFGSGPDNVARQVAWAHTLFNTIMTLAWLPFTTAFVRLVRFIRKGTESMPSRDPLFLDPRIFHNPALALEMAAKEITRMAKITQNMLESAVGYLRKMERGAQKSILEQEGIVDSLAQAVTKYLARLSQEPLGDEQSKRLVGFMHSVNDIERIGDHAENIMYLAISRHENALEFSDTAKAELDNLVGKVLEMYGGIIEAFENQDPEAARKYQGFEHEVDILASGYRRNHINRLKLGECDPAAGVVFLDTLTNLERVGDLANNVGHVVTGAIERL